jgi:protein-S-isoprenylcysteine O-methyltransferase Ste14
MVKLGNFLYHYRNFLFPVFYCLLFIPSKKVFENLWVPIVIGFLIALTGQSIRVLTIGLAYIIRGGKNRMPYAEGLVTEGMFSHCRNPLYAGNILIIVGLGIMSNSFFFIAVMIPVFLFIYQAIVRAEENYLGQKFGEGFENYKRDVHRWIPRLSGLKETVSSMQFNWMRVILKEYNSTFIWMFGAILLIIKNIWHDDINFFHEQKAMLISLLVLVTAVYLFVRYMKKSKRWKAS